MSARLRFICLSAGIACLLAAQAANANPETWEVERKLFLEARNALLDQRNSDYRRIEKQLRDYPLHPYLVFRELQNRLSRASEEEVAAFLERHKGESLGDRMRRAWLYTLGNKRDWKRYLEYYSGSQPAKLRCYALQARLHTGKTRGLVDDALELWLVGKSQEDACDPVFAWLERKGKITDELRWERIRLSIKAGQTSLAGYLARKLPPGEEAKVRIYRQAHKNPSATLQSKELNADTAINREIIRYALRRLARFDAPQAHRKWQSIKPRYRFTAENAALLDRGIALSASWQRVPEAHQWLAEVPDSAVDPRTREWRARTAAAEGEWQALATHVDNMTAEEAWQPEWRYWQALAFEQTGQELKAMDGFTRLSRERDYHGFLAADHLRWPYEMNNNPLQVDEAVLLGLETSPGFIRARELFLAKLFTNARREWAYAIRNLSFEELKAASELAHRWGWHDRAILTVAKTGDFDDLELRFPVDYADSVEETARTYSLDPGHIYAVMRQESAFNKDARSPAGAMGLMQLMPKTGKVTARKNRIPLSGTSELYLPETNIEIGSAYLNEVASDYDHNLVLASAAYNAGPHRVERWLPEDDSMDSANWIVRIPFNETRKYIQRILAYSAIYDWRLERSIVPLKKRMPDVHESGYYETHRNDQTGHER